MRVRQGRQLRSQRTLSRLLDATEALLETRSFEEIKVQDVVGRAGSSIGSFYARFPDKEALRECLLDRYQADIVRIARDELDPGRWAGRGLAERISAIVRGVVEACRHRRGLMRMRLLHNLTRSGGTKPEHSESSREFVLGLERFLAPCLAEVEHPDPVAAMSYALLLVDSIVPRVVLLDRPGENAYVEAPDERLIEEVTRMVLAYLQFPTGGPNP